MHIRILAAGACAVVALAACSSSSSTPASGTSGSSPSGPGTSGSSGTVSAAAFCQQFRSVSTKLSGLSSELGNPAQLGNKLDPVVSQLQTLENAAPAKVAPALQDLVTAMQSAAKAGKGGNMQQVEKQMQKLVPKLTTDFKQLESYVTSHCA